MEAPVDVVTERYVRAELAHSGPLALVQTRQRLFPKHPANRGHIGGCLFGSVGSQAY